MSKKIKLNPRSCCSEIKMNHPKVSILLPSLNKCDFIEERLQTIIAQTFTDWELIIVDNYSDDGAWEIIQKYAQKDQRFHISQAPRKGIYVNWSNCLDLAQGEYIYIATNDDTMTPDCLEKMVSALDHHPECDICHVKVKIINEQGEELKGWWEKLAAQQFYGDLMNKPHIRFAPYDGLLYCGLETVYFGPLQLLVRHSVYNKLGTFRSDWGPKGDFEWGMRVALVCNTIHLPETLVAWRINAQQATDFNNHISSKHRTELIEMVQAALPTLEKYNPDLYQKLSLDKLLFIYRRQRLRLALKECQNINQKRKIVLETFRDNPQFLVHFLYRKVFRPRDISDDFVYLKEELNRLGLQEFIKILPDNSSV